MANLHVQHGLNTWVMVTHYADGRVTATHHGSDADVVAALAIDHAGRHDVLYVYTCRVEGRYANTLNIAAKGRPDAA